MPRASKILDISWKGAFDEQSFAEHMARIPNLLEFHCEHSCWTPRRTCATLLRYAAHSLESLTLTEPFVGTVLHQYNAYIGSLRGFRALKTIRIDVPMVIDNVADVLWSNDSDCSVDVGEGEADSEIDEDERPSTWYIDAAEQKQIVPSFNKYSP